MPKDWVHVIEAAHASSTASDQRWGENLVETIRPLLPGADVLALLGMEHSSDGRSGKVLMSIGGKDCGIHPAVNIGQIGIQGIRELYYPERIVQTVGEVLRRVDAAKRAYLKAWLAKMGCEDCLGITLHPQAGKIVMLVAGFGRASNLPRAQRRAFTQIALHVESGFRRRHRSKLVKAAIRADGVVIHRDDDAIELAAKAARQVPSIERAKTRRLRFDEAALALWPALVSGEASLVEHGEGSRREYHVVANAPTMQPVRALTRGELDVLTYAAKGLPVKLIAYALGLSSATISGRLLVIVSKLGLASHLELIRVAALFHRDPRAQFDDSVLTEAERDVLTLVTEGRSNGEIAAIRSRSVRTIANQVGSLLRKTNAASRRTLVARGDLSP
jgi:DNA-binding NarL/FixJ family response regulator